MIYVKFHKRPSEKKNEEEVKEIMKENVNLNIVGKKSVEIALSLKVIEKDSVIKIKGVPHAQAISL